VNDHSLFNVELFRAAQKDGNPVGFLSARFMSLTAGHLLVSDAAFFDQRLMDRMGLSRKLVEFFPFVERLAKETGLSKQMLNQWINEIDCRRGQSHRAGEDAWVRAELLKRLLRPGI
jgi:hypothetical protein